MTLSLKGTTPVALAEEKVIFPLSTIKQSSILWVPARCQPTIPVAALMTTFHTNMWAQKLPFTKSKGNVVHQWIVDSPRQLLSSMLIR